MSKEINKEKNKKAVIVSCFDWYEKRLRPIKEVLEEKGYTVIVFTSDYDHIKKKKINKKTQDCIYIPVKAYKKNVSIDRLLSHYLFAKEVTKKLYSICPDLIYALVPPNSVADVCGKYKRKQPDVKLFFDIIDMWPESMPGEKYHSMLPFKYWQKLRDKSLNVADHIFTECSLYQEKLEPAVQDKCSTLFLFKEEKSTFEKANNLNIKENIAEKPSLKLCYLGSINHIIDIDGICRVVKGLTDSHDVEIRIIGKGESKNKFLDKLYKTGAKIKYYGTIFDEREKRHILMECDYAFNMMLETVCVGLSVKSIDYLSYGLPLINNLKGDTWKIIEKETIGINIMNNECIDALPTINHAHVYEIFNKYFSKNAFRKTIKKEFDLLI